MYIPHAQKLQDAFCSPLIWVNMFLQWMLPSILYSSKITSSDDSNSQYNSTSDCTGSCHQPDVCIQSAEESYISHARKRCIHYERKCWLKAECCKRYYPCRKCHDENENHEMDRYATKLVKCLNCGADDQPACANCSKCHVQFSKYFCNVCKFYDDDTEVSVYHCEHCKICRVGKGLGIDQHHCHGCGNCVPIEYAECHPCTKDSMSGNCPVCMEHLGSSTEQVYFLPCAHAIHAKCLGHHLRHYYTCPLCFKSLIDMTGWNTELDKILSVEDRPPELTNRVSSVLCNDCCTVAEAASHYRFHKCPSCRGYNTRVLS